MIIRTTGIVIFLFLVMSTIIPGQREPFPLPDLEPITSRNVDQIEQLAVLPVDRPTSTRTLIAFSPNDELLAVRDGDNCGVINIWNVTTGQSSVLKGQPFTWAGILQFGPDGAILLCIGSDEEGIDGIQLWNVQTSELLNVLKGSDEVVYDPKFSPDGTILAVGYQGSLVILWDMVTGKRLASINMETDPLEISSPPVNLVTDIEFSQDGTLLALGTIDRNELRSAVTAEKLITLRSFWTTDVAFSPDDTLLVCGDGYGVDWWAIDASENEATALLLRRTEYPGHGAVFSPDGTMLATVSGNMDNLARLWDAETGELLAELEGITDDVWNVAFSPDASLVIAQNIIWDAASGEQLLVFEDTVMLSPGGRLLALVDDGQLEIWGVPSHR